MAFNGLRLEYALERIHCLKEFIDKDVPPANLDAWQKKVEKERRILLEGV
jgi:hypothetical protein